MEEQKDNTENPDVAYDEMAVDAPTREVELPPDAPQGQSFSDRAAYSGDLTDMQAILLRLFPEQGSAGGNLGMVGRIHPDVFLPWIEILSTNEVMQADPRKPIDVAAIRMKYYSVLSIGLDGKGRIDALELGGAARDTKIAEKKLDL
jgi:hypothetical protein